jgi:2',3'-cyclic-nucleotide 2'-phosphodiesterase (5'-nucleotidase family)/predicted AlkP superfamily pyrophosphatase or phosphodiesterase
MNYQLSQFTFDNSNQILGQTPAGQDILLGGFSGLFFEKVEEGKYYFVTVPDRGPNGEPSDTNGDGIEERPFALPDYQARIVRLVFDPNLRTVEVDKTILLTRKDGVTPITGRPNLQAGNQGFAYIDEIPIDLNGNVLSNDPFGADLESVIIAPDGTYWMSDEYRPAIYHFDAKGVLIDRFIPIGTASANGDPEGTYGTETLPAVYAQRRSNRGFEGMALDPDNNKLYAWIQSPIDNPDVANDRSSRNSVILRILEVDSTNGQPRGEYIQVLNDTDKAVDKIGDAVYKGNGKFLVIERDSAVGPNSDKFVFEVDINNGTNILGTALSTATGTDALESKTEADLIAMGVNPVEKTFLFNAAELGYIAGDKTEGLALLPDGKIAILNDNDFGLLPNPLPNPPNGSIPLNPEPVPIVLGIVEEVKPPKNIVISADGLTFRFLQSFLENGQLDATTGLGYLASKGVFVPSTVITPSLTAPSHIAIATGSTAANNDINANSFHLIKSPFNSNISGFGAPIGGYDALHPHGAQEATDLTAEPLWVNLREAGKTVVAATFPGADGATITLPAVNPPVVVQSDALRTVDYTVPFGSFAGIGAQGFSLTGTDFNQNPTEAIVNLFNLGIPFYGNVWVANLENIAGSSLFGGSSQNYDLKVAAIDTTNDNQVNYDRAIVYDANVGITVNDAPPSTGSAFLSLNENIAPFFFEGSNNKAGASYILTELAEDLSTVHLIRTSANYIPRPSNNLEVLANVDDINHTIGFWRPQPDFRIAQRISPGLEDFSALELETAYSALDKTFIEYQTDVFLHAISQQNTDLALGYLEEPDGSSHQYLLTDSRQPTDPSNPNSIGDGQDAAKVARYQDLVLDAYQTVNNAVQRIIDHVGVDENGLPKSNLIITSDHGFAPFHTAVSINNILANAGFDPNEVRAIGSGPAVNIYINVQGREPNGTVPATEYKALQQQIIDILAGLFDTNPNYGDRNVPLFDRVFSREVPDHPTVEDIITASGEFIGQDTGDVFALLSLGYNFDGFQSNVARKDDPPPETGKNPILSVPTFYGAHGYDPNLTEMQATFIAAGPDFNAQTLPNLTEIRSIDIAPTILDLLEVEPADTVDGKSIFAESQQPFTLQILHASDQEAGVPAFKDIPGLSAVMNALDDNYGNTLKLTSGDLFIAGPFFDSSRSIYDNATSGNTADQPGLADILIQNELGWDVASVGNHEFDAGESTFFNLLAPNANWINGTNGGVGIGAGGYQGALFPYLANNLDYSQATLPSGLSVVANGDSPLPNTLTGSVVIDVNGESVGIIGVVTPYLKSIANAGKVAVTTLDANGNPITPTTPIDEQVDSIIANITPEVEALTGSGINKLILMTHLQESPIEQALAQKMADLGLGIDVQIGGGSHQVMATGDTIPPLRNDETQQTNGQLLQPYPQAFSSGDNTVYYINTGANYRYLSQFVATFDENGKIITVGDDSGTYATDIAGVDRLYDDDITTIDQVKAKADPEVVAIVEGVENYVNDLDGNIFGQTDFFLNGTRGDVRTQETNLGNFTSDAQDFYAEAYLTEYNFLPGFTEINISFKNGGGIRDNIGVSYIAGGGSELIQSPPQANPAVGKEEGDISELDISNSLRFNNDLVVGTVTAEGLLQIAEHMVSAVELTSGRFGQISGFKFSYEPDAPAGERIQSLALADESGKSIKAIVENGELVVNANKTFSVVTLGFLARPSSPGSSTGGDGYPLVIQNQKTLSDFAEPDTLGKADLMSGKEQDALAEYLAAFFNEDNGQSPFPNEDTPQQNDERVQNLNFRADTVLDGIQPPLPKLVSGTAGDDTFDSAFPDGKQFVGDNQILSTGSGDDTVDVTYAKGSNTIRTASGDDTIFAGTNNRIDAGAGDDLLFLGSAAGNNKVTGGTGLDIFYLTEDDDLLPENPNIIGDYKALEGDLIGLLATSLTWESHGVDWNYRQSGANTVIEAFGQDVAILKGINAITLTESNFMFS